MDTRANRARRRAKRQIDINQAASQMIGDFMGKTIRDRLHAACWQAVDNDRSPKSIDVSESTFLELTSNDKGELSYNRERDELLWNGLLVNRRHDMKAADFTLLTE